MNASMLMFLGLLFLVVYVLSVIWCRHEIIVFHSKFEFTKPNMLDVFMTFMPLFNLSGAILFSMENGRGKSISKKFFGE